MTAHDQRRYNSPLLALLTDFGHKDPYVGQLKGVILQSCPQCRIVDICHELPAFNIKAAALFLAASIEHFPPDAFFLTVVDPGVGTDRELVVLENGSQKFMAPNNGLLGLIPLKENARLWRIAASAACSCSAVFAGRDILAPVAGKLLAGTPVSELCVPAPMHALHIPEWANPEEQKPSGSLHALRAEVLHVDNFGNILLNLRSAQTVIPAEPGCLMLSYCGKSHPVRQVRCYAQIPSGALGLLPGSQGYLELAMNCASAADFLGIEQSDCKLELLWQPS
ncbi:MAG: SAM-dependent chlorinase/fluorinase [Desulfovibrionaceae bacterium]|nr:SAM-dependent chlorinase/fluorinase [Desulfovibrionaceae bacterium]